VSAAWRAGSRHRLRVLLRTWARDCSLHELVNGTGARWFGKYCGLVLIMRVKLFPAAVRDEARTADAMGFLPLHHAVRQLRDAQMWPTLAALVDAYPEACHEPSIYGSTPADLAQKHCSRGAHKLLDQVSATVPDPTAVDNGQAEDRGHRAGGLWPTGPRTDYPGSGGGRGGRAGVLTSSPHQTWWRSS